MKTAKTCATPEMFNKSLTSYKVHIPGLRHIADDLFELEDMPEPFEIDWWAVSKAIGYTDGPMPDALLDEIGGAVWRYQMAEALAARIRR